MQPLSNPPIGNAAVRAFYNPVHLIEIRIPVVGRIVTTECHIKAAPNIQAFFDIAQARSLPIRSFDGIYNPRPKRLSSEPSMHSYGAAFDIDAGTNNQGDAGGDMPMALVELGHSLGFFWGGDFRGQYVDKMHFQLGVDFPLDGRTEPKVTYQPDATEALLAAPPIALHIVKCFDVQDGHMIGMQESAGLIAADGHAYVKAAALGSVLGDTTLTAAVEAGVILLRVGTAPEKAPGNAAQ